MAKTTDFLSQTSGKLTDQFVTRQTAHGTILARAPRKTSNPRRSEKQANMRCQMANMSANFKLYQGKLKLAWEGKKAGLSEFNCFVASNYDKAPVYITKSMRVAGACVLAESYISSGSLPPIENTVNGEGFMVSDLRLGSLQIGAETTVADLTIAILQNNEEWEDGDQLTWFYGVQRVDSAGTPRASLTAEKVVLDTTDETVLYSVVSARGFTSVQGADGGQVLGMSEALVNGGGVWVHSREKDSGSIRVSSQQMKVVSEVLGQYQTYQAMVESAKSYGGINGSVAYLKPVTLATISSGASAGSGGSSQSGSANQNANENQNGGSGTGSGSESGTGSGSSSTGGSGSSSSGNGDENQSGGSTGGSTTGGSGSESGGSGGSGSGTETGGSGSGSGSDTGGGTTGGDNTGGGTGGEDEPGGDDH